MVTPHHAFAHESVAVVRMTDNGFEPRELTVDVNATVRFINDDDVERWPASNLHPTHAIYPEFDPKDAIDLGKIWEFQPKEAGSWKYHDHLFPHMRATLVVVAEDDELSTLELSPTPTVTAAPKIDLLKQWNEWKALIQQWAAALTQYFSGLLENQTDPAMFREFSQEKQFDTLRKIATRESPKAAWQFVVNTYTDEQGKNQGANRAHDLAHFVGGLIYEQEGVNGLSVCNPTFAFGCFHGFTEAAFTEKLDLLGEIAAACTALGPIRSGPWSSCIHGIGHGVATYVDTVRLDEALSVCDRLTDGQPYCYDGTFMEFSINAPSDFWKDHDLMILCTNLAPAYQSACGRSLPFLLSMRRGMNPTDTAAACLSMGNQDIAYSCIDATGLRIGQESGGNVPAIMQSCSAMPTEQTYAHCATAAAGELIFQNYVGWEVSSYQICNALPGAYRESCFERTRRVTTDYRRQ